MTSDTTRHITSFALPHMDATTPRVAPTAARPHPPRLHPSPALANSIVGFSHSKQGNGMPRSDTPGRGRFTTWRAARVSGLFGRDHNGNEGYSNSGLTAAARQKRTGP